jgi:hypothetical protein
MSSSVLQQWQQWGWLRSHQTSKQEIEQQLKLAARELADSRVAGLSTDARFAHAYASALASARAALYAAGYEADKAHSAHKYTIDSLPYTMAPDPKLVQAFDVFRAKRHKGMYDLVGAASDAEADAMQGIARSLSTLLPQWLAANHPQLT